MDFGRRVFVPEIMDGPVKGEPLLRALRFLRATNRRFGGNRVILKHLARCARSWETAAAPITILDVGCGLADIPAAVARWAEAEGLQVRITAVDLSAEIVALARAATLGSPAVSVERADVFSLPPAARYDYVIASLFLHHIPDERLGPLLARLDRLARRGMILSDLRRSRAAYWGVKALTWLIGGAMARHDGPLSVRKAFTVEELQRLAESVGLGYLRARKEPFFRVSLSGQKETAKPERRP